MIIKFSNQEIATEEIIYFFKKRVQLKEICTNFLHQKIINKAIENYNITITAEEVQAEGDKIRRQKHLEQAEDTFAWLKEELISPEDWEAGIYDDLATKKLATHLFSEAVKAFFEQNQYQFEQVLLYEIKTPYEKIAWEIFYQLEEEELSFYQAAHLYNIDSERRIRCGYVGKVYRSELPPNIGTLVFQTIPGTVTTPIASEEGYHIFLVEEFIPAELTDEIYQKLLHEMFQDWLAKELDYLLFNQTDDSKETGL
ncbi:MAG: peptidylprolyl isomerase [Halothece sp.]